VRTIYGRALNSRGEWVHRHILRSPRDRLTGAAFAILELPTSRRRRSQSHRSLSRIPLNATAIGGIAGQPVWRPANARAASRTDRALTTDIASGLRNARSGLRGEQAAFRDVDRREARERTAASALG